MALTTTATDDDERHDYTRRVGAPGRRMAATTEPRNPAEEKAEGERERAPLEIYDRR